MTELNYINAVREIKKSTDHLSSLCNKFLDDPDKVSPSRRNELMVFAEMYSLKIYANAFKVGYTPTIDKRILYRYEYLKEYVEILDFSENYIRFRVPMLPSKNAKQDLSAATINYAFQAILEKHGYIPEMTEHDIIFTHVYPASFDASHILDSDNYATTQAINMIVLRIRSTDKGCHSWHSSRTIITDELPMGTYVEIVRRAQNGAENIINLWKNKG